MAVMLAKTYEALKDAGASDEKAREAAEEIAGFESRLASIENRLIRVEVLITIVLTGVVSLVVKTFFT
ncbi:MAG: integrase [Nitrospira sp. SB0677_bin_15]|nr:integrase [Nitrospira sp. SB0667_bin_9]MYD30519.1 integrase [Nitrospira sp. SB0661_bin_20]MYG41487.1 integrase [Nitrospira sp. SB0677_bin_15]MYH01169.1 integrase [Nitrospira sp. SB0675_bin_23]MYJ23749.1 integrase [Nitrospira sp. SB0673_bin_12]